MSSCERIAHKQAHKEFLLHKLLLLGNKKTDSPPSDRHTHLPHKLPRKPFTQPRSSGSEQNCFFSPRTNSSTAGSGDSSRADGTVSPAGRQKLPSVASAHTTRPNEPLAHTRSAGSVQQEQHMEQSHRSQRSLRPPCRSSLTQPRDGAPQLRSVQADWSSGPDWRTGPLPPLPLPETLPAC